MTIIKRPLDPRRLRSVLPRGFGWIDHRFLTDGYLGQLSPHALSPKAEAYFNALRQRDLHAPGHARRILLLAGIHGNEPVAAALEEALELGAYGSDYLRNILDHRRSQPAQRGAELLFQVISIQPGQIAPLSDRPPHTSTVQAKA